MTASHRIFFALWPDPSVAQALDALAAEAHTVCGGRRMRRDTLHLTLAFLGDVDATQFSVANAVADEVAQKVGAGGTALHIDRLACWKHNHIVWAGCDSVPDAVVGLADELAATLRRHGFQLDRRPFAAHVTLLRNARCGGELPPAPALDWPVREFVLAQSRPGPAGASYEIVGRWPLTPPRCEPLG